MRRQEIEDTRYRPPGQVDAAAVACENAAMLRKAVLGGLAALAIAVAGVGYHAFVVRRSAEHYRGLIEATTVEEKRLHYDEIHRYWLPWNPWRARAEEWLREEGHEWQFLRPVGGS